MRAAAASAAAADADAETRVSEGGGGGRSEAASAKTMERRETAALTSSSCAAERWRAASGEEIVDDIVVWVFCLIDARKLPRKNEVFKARRSLHTRLPIPETKSTQGIDRRNAAI